MSFACVRRLLTLVMSRSPLRSGLRPPSNGEHVPSFMEVLESLVQAHEREVAVARAEGQGGYYGTTTQAKPCDASSPSALSQVEASPKARTLSSACSDGVDVDSDCGMGMAPTRSLRERRLGRAMTLPKADDVDILLYKVPDLSDEPSSPTATRNSKSRFTNVQNEIAEKLKSPKQELTPISMRVFTGESSANASKLQLANPAQPRKGGKEHLALENVAERNRRQITKIQEECLAIKKVIQGKDADRQNFLLELKNCKSEEEADPIWNQMAEAVFQVEAADLQLAKLREKQIDCIEGVRSAKLAIGHLIQDDRVNKVIHEFEFDMRRRKEGWFAGKKRAAFDQLAQELTDMQQTLQKDYEDTGVELEQLHHEMATTEARLPSGNDYEMPLKWDTAEGIDTSISMSRTHLEKLTMQLELLESRRRRCRHKQLAVLQSLFKMKRAFAIFARHNDVDLALQSGDLERVDQCCALIDTFHCNVDHELPAIREHIGHLVTQMSELHEKLVKMKHVHTKEAGEMRDNMCLLVFEVLVQDVRLAWLRKSQLHAIEARGQLVQARHTCDVVQAHDASTSSTTAPPSQ
eukprot:TRINITY_DN47546_c0_g1_i1.p1 TRINITY_DN47546_c0_g1~~TRINITY_DN47546_c0_g1_i1.p1  ORF type:complete len:579 (+),score=130.04 TRINITY_DN47546_c0_g1_i1:34-1770(+)